MLRYIQQRVSEQDLFKHICGQASEHRVSERAWDPKLMHKTPNRETCHNREIRNCSTATLVSRVEEMCLNSTDKFCTLVEDMKEVDEEEVILEESCEEKEEEVCDYRYKVEKTWVKEDQCVEIDNNMVNCKQENISCDVENEKYCDNTPSDESGQQVRLSISVFKVKSMPNLVQIAHF